MSPFTSRHERVRTVSNKACLEVGILDGSTASQLVMAKEGSFRSKILDSAPTSLIGLQASTSANLAWPPPSRKEPPAYPLTWSWVMARLLPLQSIRWSWAMRTSTLSSMDTHLAPALPALVQSETGTRCFFRRYMAQLIALSSVRSVVEQDGFCCVVWKSTQESLIEVSFLVGMFHRYRLGGVGKIFTMQLEDSSVGI